jgi:hypothetical protein
MPHFKCVTCRTRFSTADGPAEFMSDLCPGCGSPFEPVVELAELVGFRAITDRAQARLAAETWIHDGDAAITQAMPLPRPDAT